MAMVVERRRLRRLIMPAERNGGIIIDDDDAIGGWMISKCISLPPLLDVFYDVVSANV